MDIFPLLLLSPVLVAVAWSALRQGHVPEVFGLAAFAIFLAAAPFLDWSEVTARAGLAASVFLLGYLALTFDLVSRGEVRLLGSLMLFVPSGAVGIFGTAFMLSLLLAGSLRTAPWTADGPLAARDAPALGLPLALSGLILPVLAVAFGLAGLR